MSDFIDNTPKDDPKPHVTPAPVAPVKPSEKYKKPSEKPTGDDTDAGSADGTGNGTPTGDNPDLPGKVLYDYSHEKEKEPEEIKIEEKEITDKKNKKRRRISIETSQNMEKVKTRDPDDKGVVDKAFHGIFDIFDSLFGFFGLGNENRGEIKRSRRKDDIEREK